MPVSHLQRDIWGITVVVNVYKLTPEKKDISLCPKSRDIHVYGNVTYYKIIPRSR